LPYQEPAADDGPSGSVSDAELGNVGVESEYPRK